MIVKWLFRIFQLCKGTICHVADDRSLIAGIHLCTVTWLKCYTWCIQRVPQMSYHLLVPSWHQKLRRANPETRMNKKPFRFTYTVCRFGNPLPKYEQNSSISSRWYVPRVQYFRVIYPSMVTSKSRRDCWSKEVFALKRRHWLVCHRNAIATL